jgi:hypothetical protein
VVSGNLLIGKAVFFASAPKDFQRYVRGTLLRHKLNQSILPHHLSQIFHGIAALLLVRVRKSLNVSRCEDKDPYRFLLILLSR